MKDARDYSCHLCHAVGVKLWRRYQTFLENQRLLCVACCGAEAAVDVSTVDKDGRRPSDTFPGSKQRTDQIGWWIPAVPTIEGDTFWGYSSAPDDRVAWWRALPLEP